MAHLKMIVAKRRRVLGIAWGGSNQSEQSIKMGWADTPLTPWLKLDECRQKARLT